MSSPFYTPHFSDPRNICRAPERLILTWVMMLLSIVTNAQNTARFSFQGVARDGQGKILANTSIGLLFKIHRDSPEGNIAYSEFLPSQTNSSGVFSCSIGNNPNFKSVDWSDGTYFLQTELNITGQDAFTEVGTTQLLSVPYALIARQLREYDPVIIRGSDTKGSLLPDILKGSTMIWYPRKSAFQVGYHPFTRTDEDFGEGSTAFGNNALATGTNSGAIGSFARAKAENSIAIGNGTSSEAPQGIALGTYNSPALTNQGGDTGRLFEIGNGSSDAKRSNALTVLRNGNVGIGNNALTPDFRLDVGGRARIKHAGETAGIYFNNSSNNQEGFVGMKDNANIGFYINDSWMLWINSQGDGRIQGQLYANSDRRLKRNFSPLSNSLSKLSQLIGQHYFWKDSTKSQELQTGLIAQEVEQYFPELVATDEKGFKAVNYVGLIPHLIESVKALKSKTDEITALQKTLVELKGLEKQIADLKAEFRAYNRDRILTTKTTSK
jgi:hypothetical protein